MSKFIKREKDLLTMMVMILKNEKIYLNDLARDEDTNLVNNELAKYYETIFNDILKYYTLIGIHYTYEYDDVMHSHQKFILDFSDIKLDFINMDLEYKQLYGILNVYMMLRTDVALSKKAIEQIYGFPLSSTKLLRIKKTIECITNRKIITRKDLTYCFERVI